MLYQVAFLLVCEINHKTHFISQIMRMSPFPIEILYY